MNDLSKKERLLKLINAMSEDQVSAFLNHLESQHIGYRKYERNSCSIVTDYLIQDNTYQDFIKNISAGGVYITTQQPQPVGQDISMNFMLADSQESFRIYGKIVRSDPHGFAVKFDNELEELLKDKINA